MALILKHQTAAEFAARFWARLQRAYKSGDKQEYHRLIWWVWARMLPPEGAQVEHTAPLHRAQHWGQTWRAIYFPFRVLTRERAHNATE